MADSTRPSPSEQPRVVPQPLRATWDAATTEPDPLLALAATRALVAQLASWETTLVGEAVAEGATWEAVGGTIGVSRQAAWERFHGDVASFRERVRAEANELRARHRSEMTEFTEAVKAEARSRRGR